MCVSSVFTLTTECTSLTVTLILTLRKFFSLLFSIFYFSNPFTVHHWIGTVLVFVGTIMFTEVVPKVLKSVQSTQVSTKDKTKWKKQNLTGRNYLFCTL